MYNGTSNNMIPIAPASSLPVSKKIDIQRKKRTRAKRSCDKCRIKKTRCDADINQPCSKCRFSQTDCTFLVEQKKRGPTSGSYVEVLENRLLRMEKMLKNIAKDKRNDDTEEEIETNNEASSTSVSSNSPTTTAAKDIIDEVEEHTPNISCPNHSYLNSESHNNDEQFNSIKNQMEKMTISDFQRTRYIGASAGMHFLNEGVLESHKKYRIPEDPNWFIQKLNHEEEEHVIVKTKQVDSTAVNEIKNPIHINRIEIFEDIPYITQDFVDYIIHMYFTRVHNFCPILNKVQFLEQYYYHSPAPPDKFVLCTIIFIGVSIFKTDIMNAKVFNISLEQLKEIEEILKTKSFKVLGHVYKRSMISTVQALMLLSMFIGRGEVDDEDTSHWFIAGMAIRMAQDLGLHRDCTKWPIPAHEMELRKRIWYGAYLMDRWIAADLGRPISIIDNEFEVELPTPYELDYESTLFDNSEFKPILILEAEEARRQNKPAYSSFIYLVTLSQIAGQVLVGLYSPRAKHSRDMELVNILDKNLENWKASLPHELQLDLNNPSFYFNTTAGVVNMAYGCVLLLLYRPFIQGYLDTASMDAIKAFGTCTASATNILTIVEAMERDYFIALPWNICIFQSAIMFLHNAKGSNEYFKEHGTRNLIRCAKVYQSDPHLKVTRTVHILNSLAANFDVLMEERMDTDKDTDIVTPNTNQEAYSPAHSDNSKISEVQGNQIAEKYNIQEISNNNNNNNNNNNAPIAAPLLFNSNSFITTTTSIEQAQPLENNQRMHNPFSPDLNSFMSTKPEDMFMSSLSLSLGKNTMPNQQSDDSAISACIESAVNNNENTSGTDTHHYCPLLAFNFNPVILKSQQEQLTHYPSFNTHTTSETNQSFDITSLCSQVPLCDIPSGSTWSDWESFLKN